MAPLGTGYVIRPVAARDEQAVLTLVNADRVPGQPLATSAMLAEALAGRSGVDSAWWAELADLRTEVATTHATRPRDNAGVIMWLHGHEDRGVIDALLDHALSRLAGRPIEAFSFATALGLGMEALPVHAYGQVTVTVPCRFVACHPLNPLGPDPTG
jgi:hypothetical protein